MSEIEWPESVPVLTAEDIHQGGYNGPNGTHCLIGWCRKVTGTPSEKWQGTVVKRICDEMKALVPGNIATFNDSRPKATVASVWNDTMRRLGYTEIEEVDA